MWLMWLILLHNINPTASTAEAILDMYILPNILPQNTATSQDSVDAGTEGQ
jgi:hypothetical protein